MATYTDYLRLRERGELKRAYAVYGDERRLVENVVGDIRERVAAHDLDYGSFSAAISPTQEIWAAMNAYPLAGRRLVIVRDAERIKDWRMLTAFTETRQLPTNHVVLVLGGDYRSPTEKLADDVRDFAGRVVLPASLRDPKIRLVRCTGTEQVVAGTLESMGISVVRDKERHLVPTCQAAVLMRRVGGSLSRAMDVVEKAKRIARGREIPDALLEVLSEPRPVDTFTDSLLALKKDDAVRAAELVELENYPRVLRLLDTQLDALRVLNGKVRRGKSIGDIVSETQIPDVVVRKLKPVARYYNTQEFLRRLQLLHVVDDMVRSTFVSERYGLLEMLVGAW